MPQCDMFLSGCQFSGNWWRLQTDSVMCLQVDVVRYGIVRYGIVDYSMISLPYRGVRAPIFHFSNRGLIPKGTADCLINCDVG